MRLGIVGSRGYTNRERIKTIVERYVTQYGAGNLIIVSGGCPKGADFLGKQIALELGLLYEEHAPRHAKYNQYCVQPPESYNKPYNIGHYFERNGEIAQSCDHLVAFIIKDVKCNGTMDTVTKAYKLKKHVFLFEDES